MDASRLWKLVVIAAFVALIAVAARALWSWFRDRNKGKRCSDHDWRPVIKDGEGKIVIGKSYDQECRKCGVLRSQLPD